MTVYEKSHQKMNVLRLARSRCINEERFGMALIWEMKAFSLWSRVGRMTVAEAMAPYDAVAEVSKIIAERSHDRF